MGGKGTYEKRGGIGERITGSSVKNCEGYDRGGGLGEAEQDHGLQKNSEAASDRTKEACGTQRAGHTYSFGKASVPGIRGVINDVEGGWEGEKWDNFGGGESGYQEKGNGRRGKEDRSMEGNRQGSVAAHERIGGRRDWE